VEGNEQSVSVNGFISKIQRYSTKDGPGLRSTVFAVGCTLRCQWCSNPELTGEAAKILYHAGRCVRCGACVEASGGTIRSGVGGCVIDREACMNLDECADACYYDAYEKLGMTVSAEELATMLLRDKVFYDQSGGGVTYSGGESALQADFFLDVTKRLKPEGVHVALDTAGNLPWEQISPLIEAVDLVLYDLKTLDSALHERYTGADNRLILENARKIADMGKVITVRLILVPGVNDTEEEIGGRLEFARNLGKTVKADILKYHRLGAGKYISLGLDEPMKDTPECPDETAEYAVALAAKMGLTATIGG